VFVKTQVSAQLFSACLLHLDRISNRLVCKTLTEILASHLLVHEHVNRLGAQVNLLCPLEHVPNRPLRHSLTMVGFGERTVV
jgi:hypothetical protein